MMMMEMDALLVWVEHHHHVGWNDHWPSIYPNWYPLDTRLNQHFKCIDTWYQSKRKATSSSWSTSNLCAWNLKNTHFVPYSYVWIPVNGLVRLMSSWARHEGTDSLTRLYSITTGSEKATDNWLGMWVGSWGQDPVFSARLSWNCPGMSG